MIRVMLFGGLSREFSMLRSMKSRVLFQTLEASEIRKPCRPQCVPMPNCCINEDQTDRSRRRAGLTTTGTAIMTVSPCITAMTTATSTILITTRLAKASGRAQGFSFQRFKLQRGLAVSGDSRFGLEAARPKELDVAVTVRCMSDVTMSSQLVPVIGILSSPGLGVQGHLASSNASYPNPNMLKDSKPSIYPLYTLN